MKICFCVLIIQIVSTSCIFPDHIDLQKITEVKYDGEKYKLLKPTIHKMEDYFKAFIQKRSNSRIPKKRVFLDRNGFRHHWEGMFEKTYSSRKSDTKVDNIRNETEVIEDKDNTTNTREGPTRKLSTTEITPTPSKHDLREEGPVEIVTTFFCPHFGLLKMTSKFDHFEPP